MPDLNHHRPGQLDLRAVQQLFGGSLIWVGAAFLCIMAFLFQTIRIERVTGEQVGFLLNKINGEITVIPNSGAQIFNGLTKQFYVLDKTLQTMEMTEQVGQGDRKGKDDLKIKTVDGSDVYVDLKIQFRMDVDMAETVLRTSGPGNAYKEKWARDYVRSVCRNYLGELKTEEFYDASLRAVKISAAKIELNNRLRDYGIVIDEIVIPRRPHFYADYEEMIKKKKLADQVVLQEQSTAAAAKQKQLTQIVTETNKKKVAIEQYEGEMSQKVIAEKAAAELAMKQADAYFVRETFAAGARLYEMEKTAEATLAQKSAEAAGIKKLKEALEGEGGRNMVKLEYAKKLKTITFSGEPFVKDGSTARFEHLRGPASAVISQ